MTSSKKIGFLSFGAWHPGGGLTHTGGDALRQTVELAVAAEEIGIDGAFVRVHHFARQLASPFPLLAAIGVRTSRIEIGTGVIDMRYENALYMAETAAAADLLAGGRLQLGVSRGSPEPAWHGAEAFGYSVDPGEAREKTALGVEHQEYARRACTTRARPRSRLPYRPACTCGRACLFRPHSSRLLLVGDLLNYQGSYGSRPPVSGEGSSPAAVESQRTPGLDRGDVAARHECIGPLVFLALRLPCPSRLYLSRRHNLPHESSYN